jgi:hypothetical protein
MTDGLKTQAARRPAYDARQHAHLGVRGIVMTKITATVHVEFELSEGQANHMATTALIGGVGALKLAIERGVTGTGQTGVKTGTVQANIVDQEIT